MAKLNLALIVSAVDKASVPLRRIQKTVGDLNRSGRLARLGRGILHVVADLRSCGSHGTSVPSRGGIGALIGVKALKEFAEIERLETAFESMTGSAEASEEDGQGLDRLCRSDSVPASGYRRRL